MKTATLLLCLTLPALGQETAPAADAPAAQTVMLRLRSGEFLWGSIEDHEPERVHFRRLDTGGLVKLPWSFLDPAEEDELRLRFGYVDALAEEIMVSADRIQLTNGQELIGIIVGRTDDFLYVKRADSTVPVAKRLVTGATTIVQVPALDVYNKEELYQQRFLELQADLIQPGEAGARAHLELAEYAERLFDYAHAVHHYRQAQLTDASYQADYVDASIQRTSAKAELQEQIDLLAEIDLLRARKLYAKAIEALESFPALYPDSPLLEDWNALRERVRRYQDRDLREQVVRRWHYWSVELARRAVRELESFEACLAYCEEGFTEDLVARVTEDVSEIAPEIRADEVQRLWQEREGGRFRQATYSLGTWLLGEEKAKAGLAPEEEEEGTAEPEAGSAAAERKRLEERLRRYFQNQELARSKQAGTTDEQEEPEAFWSRWRSTSRAQWLLAYFVEFSGHFSLSKVLFANCRECGGTGARAVIYTGGAIAGATAGERLVVCPTCHGFQVVRRLRYR